MKARTIAILALSVAVGAAAPAAAQDAALTEEKVRGFFEPLAEQAESAVDRGDWSGIMDWYREHLAPGATIAIDGSVVTRHGAALSYQATFDRRDLGRFMRMALVGHRRGLGAIEDYTLAIDVRDVTILPNGEASAHVVFTETGLMRPGGMRPRGQGRGPRADAAGASDAGTGGAARADREAMREAHRAARREAGVPGRGPGGAGGQGPRDGRGMGQGPRAGQGPGDGRGMGQGRAMGQGPGDGGGPRRAVRRGPAAPTAILTTSRCDLRLAAREEARYVVTLAACDVTTTM